MMLIKVFSLRFDPLVGSFDDTPVRDFSQDKEILQVRDHLLIRNEIPYLVLVIKYYPFRVEAGAEGQSKERLSSEVSSSRNSGDAWKKEITDAEMPLFNRLRDWRSERCKKDGVPPYLIFTNQQLAAIAKKKPQSLVDLGQVEGVGPGKLERYGVDVLSVTVTKAEEPLL
jgi:superfamily II DNA helicase RecQ